MKKLLKFSLLCLALCFTPHLSAQRIYSYLLKQSHETMSSPTSNFTRFRLALFSKQALIFMKEEGQLLNQELPDSELDTQAYFLANFLSCYFDKVLCLKRKHKDKTLEKKKRFIEATSQNPLFNNVDPDESDIFIHAACTMTPFSLNTNWKKAYESIKK